MFSMQNDPQRAQLVQSYMMLHSQQTLVRRRLSSPPSSPTTSVTTSPTLATAELAISAVPPSPVRRSSRPSPSSSPARRAPRAAYLRRPSVPSIPELPEPEDDCLDADEAKLLDLSQQIKITLTNLLNCESVKRDGRMRQWVQVRLMDAQQSLNERRRVQLGTPHRRSSSAAAACADWSDGSSSPPQSPSSDEYSDSPDKARKLSI